MTLDAAYFDDLYGSSDDPWGFQDRWYEERKRALTLALLPDRSYGSTVELGCSIGVLTAALASRCRALLATDVSEAAVKAARRRCSALPQVVVEHTADLPSGPFDLAVVSEVLYYFASDEASRVAAWAAEASTVLGVHWRHPVDDYPLRGDDAQRLLGSACEQAGHQVVGHYVDEDLTATVWSRDPASVATREGLV